MNHNHQIYRDRRAALLKQMRDANRRGPRARADRSRGPAQSRLALSVPPRQLLLLRVGISGAEAVVALVASPDGDRQVLFCREKNRGTRNLGRLPLRTRRGARDLRFRRSPPDRSARQGAPDLAADRPALYTPLGLFASWDRRVTELLNEVRNRARTGVSRAGRDRRRAAGARCAAPREGRA